MSIPKTLPGTARGEREEVCPFLGLPEDSQTSLSYPSSWNVCHHSKPVAAPSLDFQQSFCFSKNHSNCPVYTRTGRAPMPSGIRFQASKPPIQKRLLFSILAGGVLLILAVTGVVWAIQDSRNHGGNLPVATESATPTVTKGSSPTATLPFTDTPAPATLTATPTLSLTSTPTGSSTRPTDTLWPSLTPTRTATVKPTRTPSALPTATATFLPTATLSPTVTHWPSLTSTTP